MPSADTGNAQRGPGVADGAGTRRVRPWRPWLDARKDSAHIGPHTRGRTSQQGQAAAQGEHGGGALTGRESSDARVPLT